MSRLDYFLAPQGTFGSVSDCTILPAIHSDHCPVIIELAMTQEIRGPGFWKFNVTHLSNKDFVDEVNKIIDYANYRYDNLNPINKWEMIKHDIREYAVIFSKEKAKQKHYKKEILERKLHSYRKKLNMINLQSEFAVSIIQATNEKIDSVLKELHTIELCEAQGAMLRSKVRWVESGEKNTKYFFALEKQRSI